MAETEKNITEAEAIEKVQDPKWRKSCERTLKSFIGGSTGDDLEDEIIECCRVLRLTVGNPDLSELLGAWGKSVRDNNSSLLKGLMANVLEDPCFIMNARGMYYAGKELDAAVARYVHENPRR